MLLKNELAIAIFLHMNQLMLFLKVNSCDCVCSDGMKQNVSNTFLFSWEATSNPTTNSNKIKI